MTTQNSFSPRPLHRSERDGYRHTVCGLPLDARISFLFHGRDRKTVNTYLREQPACTGCFTELEILGALDL